MDTQNCQLYALLEWHPQSTSFPAGDTSNTFLDFWHYSVSFMAFLITADVAVFHNIHSLSMQYRCHATTKMGTDVSKAYCLPTSQAWKKRDDCNYMKVLHIMGNHCSAQSQHKFHPHFYSNAFPLSQMLCLSLHTTVLDMNLSICNFCY